MTRSGCLAPALAALALTACGSSGDGSSDGPSQAPSAASGQLSRAQLIAEADKICAATAAKIRAQPAPTSLADIEQVSDTNANTSAAGAARLRELQPPESLKADYAAFVQQAEMVAEQSRAVAAAARTNDMSKVIEATGNLAGDAESHRLARKIGFKVCRSGPVSLLPPGAPAPEAPSPP